MSLLYELIGRMVVLVVRLRFRRQAQIAAGVSAAAAVGVAYLLASRNVEEG